MFPCELKRQDCLVGAALENPYTRTAAKLLSQHALAHMASPVADASDVFWARDLLLFPKDADDMLLSDGRPEAPRELSTFERIITSHPPILESLISQLPTRSVIDLFHTSAHLRSFLEEYPLAWKTLSFRLPQPTVAQGSPGVDTPDARDRQSRHNALDGLLFDVILPVATRLRNLDLCNTAVQGMELILNVMGERVDTIQHLSVRGCKNVSIKYHIVPFLQMYTKRSVAPGRKPLALKSLYTYRCRHHRRRPYLPSSLIRRDSDSEPTHDLIELCHQLGIWTDTAWCPTPGGRCFRRKDYHGNRAAPGTQEVWVPFDRLWRSGNRIGPTDEGPKLRRSDGRLWEDAETGHDGEPLGSENGPFRGEGKDLTAHLRKSHRTFVEEIKCDDCGEQILERCETCSIKMHCMGCRKTLCASCSFDRPIPRKRQKVRNFETLIFGANGVPSLSMESIQSNAASNPNRNSDARDQKDKFWWAPGATRSPNLMVELPLTEDDSSDSDDAASNGMNAIPLAPSTPPKLNMHWCCLEPIFSGGGGVAFLGPQLGGSGSDRIRAVPLPRKKNYKDADFISPHALAAMARKNLKNLHRYESIMGSNLDVLPYLEQEQIELQANTCPRSLCRDCYWSSKWKVPCRACEKPLCKEHDFRALKVRKCGLRELSVDREFLRNQPPPQPSDLGSLRIPAFGEKTPVSRGKQKLVVSDLGEFDSPAPSNLENPMTEDDDVPLGMLAEAGDMTRDSSVHSFGNALDRSCTPALSFELPSSMQLSYLEAGRSTPTPCVSAFAGPSLYRPRSLSLSGLSGLAGMNLAGAPEYVPEDRTRVATNPLLGKSGYPVQWQGCGAYFCPQVRPVGDLRGRCTADIRECGECGVFVCQVSKPRYPDIFFPDRS